jgi:hypothetical protein
MSLLCYSVHLAIKKLGLPTRLPDPEKEILALLLQNVDREEVAKQLHCSLRAVKRVGAKHHTKKKIVHDPFHGKRARIDAAIRQRLVGQAINIAREFRVPYRQVLKRAHEIHGPGKFVGGRQQVPFVSYFPQRLIGHTLKEEQR